MVSEFAKNLVKGEAVNSSFVLLTTPLSLINSLIVIRFLSLHDYGVYNLVLSFYAIIAGFSFTFMDNLVLNEMNVYYGQRHATKAKKAYREYVIFKLIVCAILAVAIFFGSDLIGQRYGQDSGTWIRIVSFLFIAEGIKALFILLLQYRLNFFLSSSYTFIFELVKLLLILFVHRYRGLGVSEVLSIMVACHALILPFLLPAVIKGYFQKEGDEPTDTHQGSVLWTIAKRYGPWAIARHYFLNFSQNIRPWLINHYLGTEAVAIFSVASSFFDSLKSLVSFNSLKVFLPRELDNHERMMSIVTRGGRYITYAYFVIMLSGSLGVYLLVTFFFPKYTPSLHYFAIIVFALLIYGLFIIVSQILYSLRRQKEIFLIPVIGFTSTVILTALFVPWIKLYGVALEFLLTQIITFLAAYAFLLRVRPELRISWRTVFIPNSQDKALLRRGWDIIKAKSSLILLKRKREPARLREQ